MNSTKDIIVLVGAGQIGMAIARRIGFGKKIFVADWKLENAQAIAKIMVEAGFDVVPFKTDIASRNSILELIEAANEKGEIAMLIKDDLKIISDELFKHFTIQRNCFYSAESLEKFSRDNFPDAIPFPFDELKEESLNLITTVLFKYSDKTGFDKLINSILEIQGLSFNSSPLSMEIKSDDKAGICHHLANEEKICWINI